MKPDKKRKEAEQVIELINDLRFMPSTCETAYKERNQKIDEVITKLITLLEL